MATESGDGTDSSNFGFYDEEKHEELESNDHLEEITENFLTEVHQFQTFNGVMLAFYFILLIFLVYLVRTRVINDFFVSKAVPFLGLALVSRIVMSTMAIIHAMDLVDRQNIPLQQVYFEVPFYCFVLVTCALFFSWYQFLTFIKSFISGEGLTNFFQGFADASQALQRNHESYSESKINEKIQDSAVSLERLDESAKSFNEPLLSPARYERSSLASLPDGDKHTKEILNVEDGINAKLAGWFKIAWCCTALALTINTSLVLINWYSFDQEEKDDLFFWGTLLYLFNFFFLFFVQVVVYALAWVVYIKLHILLKPDSSDKETDEDDTHFLEEDNWENQQKSRSESVRKSFAPRFWQLSLQFAAFLFILTVRGVLYVWQRLSSSESLLQWKTIPPLFSYINIISELFIGAGVVYYIWTSTQRKDKTEAAEFEEQAYRDRTSSILTLAESMVYERQTTKRMQQKPSLLQENIASVRETLEEYDDDSFRNIQDNLSEDGDEQLARQQTL